MQFRVSMAKKTITLLLLLLLLFLVKATKDKVKCLYVIPVLLPNKYDNF